jgi:Ca2+-transporting ATPase
MIYPVHTRVSGRARFKVNGLSRSEPLKRSLETRLSQYHFIKEVSASIVTGNILIIFDPQKDHNTIALLIRGVLLKSLSMHALDVGHPAYAFDKTKAVSDESPHPGQGRHLPAIKEKIKDIFAGFAEQKKEDWHLLHADEVLGLLGSSKDHGLSMERSHEFLKRFGPNSLPESKPRSKWQIFVDQFISLPVALLGAAAGLSVLTGGIFDAIVIMGVVAANAAIGYATESEADKTIQSLKRMVTPTAEVIRGGCIVGIEGEEVVPGDILVLKPGSYVAADARVVDCYYLSIDESVLTGESMPLAKKTTPLRIKNMPLADRVNMTYMGTLVTGGRGLAVVVATGRFTEIGRLQVLLEETTSPETPIERQLRVMGNQLVLICSAICGLVFLMGFVRGYSLLRMLRLSVSLAAAAVPEGLPAAATINFALGIKNMRRHGILIRQLQAVETIGAVQTICLDKTGTITQNKMSVKKIHVGMRYLEVKNGEFITADSPVIPLDNIEIRNLAYACVLCNETKIINGNDSKEYQLSGSPTENALVDWAILSGVDVPRLRKEYKLQKVTYRSENHMFMSTDHSGPNGGGFFSVKGRPGEVLGMCKSLYQEN